VTKVYRLVKAARADDAFSGEGARRYGGRWNRPGHPVVYASESRALAVLEAFAHLTAEARTMSFLLYEVTLPPRPRLLRVSGEMASGSRQETGLRWFEDARALALVVPSVIVPQEANYVLNVRHSQFAKLRIGRPEAFSFDERLWQGKYAT
jgi:RES domain-containing protein